MVITTQMNLSHILQHLTSVPAHRGATLMARQLGVDSALMASREAKQMLQTDKVREGYGLSMQGQYRPLPPGPPPTGAGGQQQG